MNILETLTNSAARRGYLIFATGAVSVAVGVGVLDASHKDALTGAFNDVFEGLTKLIGGFSVIVAIVGPAIGALFIQKNGVRGTAEGRMTDLDAQSKADGLGLKMVVADNSTLAPAAAALPGNTTTVVEPSKRVTVTVPPASNAAG